MRVRVKITGSEALQRAIKQSMDRASKAAGAGLFVEAERIMAKSKTEAPVGVDGILRASGFVDPAKRVGAGWEVRVGYGGAAKSYAIVVHEGRKPGSRMPPARALIPWVRKKLGVAADEAEGVAWLVARKIKTYGTTPKKFLERPLRESLDGMGNRLALSIRRALERR